MTVNEIVNYLNGIAWGPWMLILLVGTGVYLSFRVGFLQFRKFGYAMKNTIGKIFQKQSAAGGEVTPFQAMTTALAATVGTGNIIGVAGAIVIGGPGSIFWMWICGLLGMALKFAEATLAIRYQTKNAAGETVGGPMYMIKGGLPKALWTLASVYAFFGVVDDWAVFLCLHCHCDEQQEQ